MRENLSKDAQEITRTEMRHWITEQGLKFKIVPTHISQIRVGDTIKCRGDGLIRTVCRNNIKHDNFMGISLFGDSYHFGYLKVDKVIIFTH